jgi:serine phosphatase RsbU (regulator of sigma subunit)/Tfp pilus assembly protein PilF
VSPFFAQDVSQLLQKIETAKHDTTKLELLVSITDICDIPEIKNYAEEAIKLAEKIEKTTQSKQAKIQFQKGNATINLGFYYHHTSNYSESIKEYEKAYEIFKKIPDSSGMALALNNLSMVYENKGEVKTAIELLNNVISLTKKTNDLENQNSALTNLSSLYSHLGDYSEALKAALGGLKIQEEINSLEGMGYSLNNIGTFYFKQQDFENAKKYLLKSIKVREQIGDEMGASNTYLNLAIIAEDNNESQLALDYIHQSITIRKKLQIKEQLAVAYIKLGDYFENKQKIDSAEFYYLKAHQLNTKTETIEGRSDSYRHLADIYLKQGKVKKAEKYGEKGLELAQKLGYPEDILPSAATLKRVYDATNNYKKAYQMYQLYIEMKDSTTNEKNQRDLIQQNLNYEYEKQKIADSLAFAVEKEVTDLKLQKTTAELEKTNTRNIALGIGVLMLIILVSITLFAYRNKRKAAEIIALQKQKVEEQKLMVEEKNHEITDSISYAKRIQDAILPNNELLKRLLPNSFVFYKPKDIVAGDFYWIEKKGDLVIFAAADCTGHGVPGAIVSVVCHNALNRSVKEYNLIEPHLILEKTREIIIEQFNETEDNVRDGMDIALCVLNTKNLELQFCGANNPLYLISDNELLETKPDKQPVGKYSAQKPFSNNKIQLKKNDAIYLFSDGFADQFGGPKGKKYKYKPFKNLLISIQNKTMEEQLVVINDAFINWQGDHYQIDDVCVLGVKI